MSEDPLSESTPPEEQGGGGAFSAAREDIGPDAAGEEPSPSDISPTAPAPERGEDSFPVVGIGASAGGLRAFQEFFDALPPEPDMAFVLVQHLSPDHESALAELIQTKTKLSVNQVTDHPGVEPNCVYVIPPGKHLELRDGHLELVELKRERGKPTAIDHFFRSLAREVGERAVAVVLSGTGSDGSLGLKAVKERAGLTLAQAPDDAEYDGMPKSAIATGLVDLTGTAAELAQRLVDVRRSAATVRVPRPDEEAPATDEQALRTIFARLRQRTGHDFTHYKRSTILRRLARRLQVNGIGSLAEYAAFLVAHPEEPGALLRDFLISVTQFFRDPEAFDVLEAEVIAPLLERTQRQIRVWVPGCATGEEAYTLAMLLCEHAERLGSGRPDIQIFATDIDEDALAHAREGVYPDVVAADLSDDRLRTFFQKEGGGYRVKPELRELVLFAPHNLVSDPPFSRLDLVSCRNVLIYFNRAIQERAFASFHYALRPDGYLFLGSSEAPDSVMNGFVEVEKKHRIYRRRDVQQAPTDFPFPKMRVRPSPGEPGAASEAAAPEAASVAGLLERYRQWTLDQYAPPRLLVDDRYDLTHVFGRAGDYLRDREGPVTQNVVDKVLRAFRIDLRTALYRAFAQGESVDTPFRRIELGAETRVVRLHVGPVGGAASQDGLAEVVFVELDPASVKALGAVVPPDLDPDDHPSVVRLEEELRATRSRLQANIEEQETSNEELKASNEELQSINEELQSATEELETSKEELQSMNEELTTVNQELKNKVEELTRSNSDLQNLMGSMEVATLFLDGRLGLKRYTPRATDLFNIIPADVGRPFHHLSHALGRSDLADRAQEVLDTLIPIEEVARTDDGETYLFHITPYRTVDDRIDGVVLTFVNVTEVEAAKAEATARAEQQAVVARLGEQALAGATTQELFDQAVVGVRDALGADACKVLHHEPEGEVLRLVAGVGWDEGAVGEATVPDASDSQAGYTMLRNETVFVDDLESETRFSAPLLLTGHDMKSGMSVVIAGVDGGAPYGVIGVHCQGCRNFTEADGRFLQSVANVLADAVEAERQRETIREQLAEIEAFYETAPVGLAFIDRELRYQRVNQRLAEINGWPVEEHVGRRTRDLIPALADTVEPILCRVLEAREAVEDVEIPGPSPVDPDADPRVWLCSFVPRFGDDGDVEGINVVVQDITDRKRAEEALAETAEQLDLALDAGQLGIFERDFASDTIRYDKRGQALYGLPPGEPVERAFDRIHPDDLPGVLEAVSRASSPDGPGEFAMENRLVLDDGSVRWISSRGRTLFEGAGAGRMPVRLIGTVTDVTDRKQTEAALAEAASRLDLAMEGGGLGAFEADLVAGAVTFDKRAQALLGVPATTSVDGTFLNVHPDDLDEVRSSFEAATDPQNPDPTLSTVYRHLRDDRTLWVTVRGVCRFEGEGEERRPVRVLGVAMDVTAIREAEEQVQRQLAEVESYFDAVPVGIAVFDDQGRYVRVNERMSEIIDQPTEDIVGTEAHDLLPDHALSNGPYLRRVLETGLPILNVEMKFPLPSDPEGNLYDWLVSFYPLRREGEVAGASAVVQNVTAIRKAQAGLEKLTAELEERVRSRTAQVRELAADLTEAEQRERKRVAQVLHDDLQQVLYALQVKHHLIQRAVEGDMSVPAPASELIAQADALLSDAIQSTRSLTVDLSPPILRGEGLDRTLEWLAHRMKEAYGLDVALDADGGSGVGGGLQILLFQIVRELLFNVVKHAGTGEARVTLADEPGTVVVTVSDDGVGFDPESAGKAPSGFGIVSVRERIGLVGGTVEVASEAGEGTTVTVRCPVEDVA